MGKRILVTGGAGFIGRQIIRSLSPVWDQSTDDVPPANHVIDILDKAPVLFKNLKHLSSFRKFLTDVESVKNEYDVIIHAAGISDSRFDDVEKLMKTNYEMTAKLFDKQQSFTNCKMIYFSSASVYGDLPCDEETNTFQPQTPYACSKLLGDHLVRGTLRTCIVRPFNVYGQGEFSKYEHTQSFIYRVACAAANMYRKESRLNVHSLDTLRDFISVEDVGNSIAGFVNSAMNGHFFQGEVYNFGRGKAISIRDIIATAADEIGGSQQFAYLVDNPYKPDAYQNVSKALFTNSYSRPYDPTTFRDPLEDLRLMIRFFRSKKEM